MRRQGRHVILLLLVFLATITGCSQVPITGRNRLMLIGASRENRLGAQAFEQFIQGAAISHDPKQTALVQQVGRRIAEKAHVPDAQWQFELVESDEVNAFALPGGKIVVYAGILNACPDEASLAAIIGHEAGHVIARHAGERMSIGLAVSIVLGGAELATGKMEPAKRAAILAAMGMGAQVGVSLPYSRLHEYEADAIGTRLMARAGYDPAAAWEFWQRMAERNSTQPVEFLSTHPAGRKRMEALKEMMPEMQQLYRKAPIKYGRGQSLAGGR